MNQCEELLRDLAVEAALHRARRAATSKPHNESRARPAPLRKSAPAPSLQDVLAKAQAANVVGKIVVSKLAKPAGMPNMEDTPEPAILRHEALRQAMAAPAARHKDWNRPSSEKSLTLVLRMGKPGHVGANR